MDFQKKTTLYDIVLSVSEAVDLISANISNHHKQVAVICWHLASEMNLSVYQKNHLIISALLHDIGVIPLTLNERYKTFNFEIENPNRHAEIGYLILKNFAPLRNIADVLRYHHTMYFEGADNDFDINEEFKLFPYIIHLADRVSILANTECEILFQVSNIVKKIKSKTGMMFHPEIFKVFEKVAKKEGLWFDVIFPDRLLDELKNKNFLGITLNKEEILQYAELFRRIIDFRSAFTSTHSVGTASVAAQLAYYMDFTQDEIDYIKIAGLLHDVGKLAIPVEILEKKDKLTDVEFNIIKSHPYFTDKILSHVPGFETINEWASRHHEKLDGSGYPNHLGKRTLSTGSRILTVADIFTALAEDRPYRPGLPAGEIIGILHIMVKDKKIDEKIFTIIKNNIENINGRRQAIQMEKQEIFDTFAFNVKNI
ncbi:MAG: HD-GYP domain-containing protein [Candidatus Muiribacteriota bacterium]